MVNDTLNSIFLKNVNTHNRNVSRLLYFCKPYRCQLERLFVSFSVHHVKRSGYFHFIIKQSIPRCLRQLERGSMTIVRIPFAGTISSSLQAHPRVTVSARPREMPSHRMWTMSHPVNPRAISAGNFLLIPSNGPKVTRRDASVHKTRDEASSRETREDRRLSRAPTRPRARSRASRIRHSINVWKIENRLAVCAMRDSL